MRDKVLAFISAAFVLCGFIGLKPDWTMYVLVIPFGWGLLACFLDLLINNKKGTRISYISSTCGALLLTNMALIFIHRDTPFIIGRFLCAVGLIILIIRTSAEKDK